MKTSYTVPFAIVFGGLIVAGAVYTSTPRNPTPTNNAALVRPISASDHLFGNPAAPVTIVEYADLDCTHCKDFDEALHQIIATAGAEGKVSWIFRHFPLTEIHPDALKHAEAAECAAHVGGNDAFWRFKTELFAHQPIDPSQYGTYAKAAGLAGEAFATCFSQASATFDARILADRKNALDMGAIGTPYSVILIAGKEPIVIDSAYPYNAMKQIIDDALVQ